MLVNQFKSYCLGLLILLSTAGVFAHGFEHSIIDDDSQCTQLIHNQFEVLDSSSEPLIEVPTRLFSNRLLVTHSTNSLQVTAYPYKNNSPPIQ